MSTIIPNKHENRIFGTIQESTEKSDSSKKELILTVDKVQCVYSGLGKKSGVKTSSFYQPSRDKPLKIRVCKEVSSFRKLKDFFNGIFSQKKWVKAEVNLLGEKSIVYMHSHDLSKKLSYKFTAEPGRYDDQGKVFHLTMDMGEQMSKAESVKGATEQFTKLVTHEQMESGFVRMDDNHPKT